MQIFFTHVNPFKAAANITFDGKKPNGKSVRLGKKMTIESFQLLSMQLWLDGHTPEKIIGCPPAHQSHESRMWLDKSHANISWLLYHALGLIRLNGCPNGEKLNSGSINTITQLIRDKYDGVAGVSLPHLAMRSTDLDLCEIYGNKVKTVTHTGNPKEYYLANSLQDACQAYREFLRRKDYFDKDHILA